MNLNSSDFELINNFSNDALIYKSRISLNRVNEVKNSLLGPDVVFEPSTFNFMNENQNVLYNYDNNSMYYLVGEREFQLKNNSIFGVYEEIYDVEEDNDFIYVYSNLVSYNAIYSFDLKNEDQSNIIPLDDNQAMAQLGAEIGRNVVVNLTNITKVGNRQIAREIKQINAEQEFAYNS